MSFSLAAVLVSALHLLSSSSIHAQNLTAVKCTGALPNGRHLFALLYDKDDSIYLFGGSNGRIAGGGSEDRIIEVVKYSISRDTTELAGQLPYGDYGGAAVMNKLGNIFYLSGITRPNIYQYFPDSRSFVNVSMFAQMNYYYGTTVVDPDTALIFGGGRTAINASTQILSLNLNTLESEQIGQLLVGSGSPAPMWVEEKGAAYIFNVFNAGRRTAQKYYRASNRTELLPLELPMDIYEAVWDGHFIYLLDRLQSILQFVPETEAFTAIPVEGYPISNGDSAVYIEKLNRIYIFGGRRSGVYLDEVLYIDLDPIGQPPTTTSTPHPTTTEETPISTVDPDIFNCVGRRDSEYPYPGDCTKFIICLEDRAYPFDCSCSEPLHFDPLNRRCTFPQMAGCE